MTGHIPPKLFLAAKIPPDLHTALAQRYELTDREALKDWPARPCPGFAVAVTTSMAGMDASTFDALPDLRLVLCNGAGLDRLDLAAAQSRGIAIAHTPDELADDVGEAAIALTYAIMRRIAEGDRFVRAGRWSRERITPSTRVAGKTMGIVGLGRIGRRVAGLAEGIGMQVFYTARRPAAGVPYPFIADLHELAAAADVLVLACSGGEATRNLVDRAVLDRLGPKGFLINVSRGSVVDEQALIDALQRDAIAGAGLDVFASEPDIDSRFLALENVVLQPHSTSITHETRAAMIGRLLGDLEAFLNGRPFHDVAAHYKAQKS